MDLCLAFQPPRLISMQALQRGGVNGSSHMYPPHHLRMVSAQNRMPSAQPRLNGQPYPMMQPQLQRQVSAETLAGHMIKNPQFKDASLFLLCFWSLNIYIYIYKCCQLILFD